MKHICDKNCKKDIKHFWKKHQMKIVGVVLVLGVLLEHLAGGM